MERGHLHAPPDVFTTPTHLHAQQVPGRGCGKVSSFCLARSVYCHLASSSHPPTGVGGGGIPGADQGEGPPHQHRSTYHEYNINSSPNYTWACAQIKKSDAWHCQASSSGKKQFSESMKILTVQEQCGINDYIQFTWECGNSQVWWECLKSIWATMY